MLLWHINNATGQPAQPGEQAKWMQYLMGEAWG